MRSSFEVRWRCDSIKAAKLVAQSFVVPLQRLILDEQLQALCFCFFRRDCILQWLKVIIAASQYDGRQKLTRREAKAFN